MKKRIVNLLIALLVVCLINTGFLIFLTYSALSDGEGIKFSLEKKPVVISRDYDKGQSMDKALATGKPIITWFYADWCGYCQKLAPTFKKLTTKKSIKDKYAVAYVNAEDPSNKGLVEQYHIQAFPTVYIVDGIQKDQISNFELFQPDALKKLEKKLLNK